MPDNAPFREFFTTLGKLDRDNPRAMEMCWNAAFKFGQIEYEKSLAYGREYYKKTGGRRGKAA